jgi:heptosyltransferase-1
MQAQPPSPTQLASEFVPVERLLIVRLSSMGDVIHTLPAVTALRVAFPECYISWVIEERWAELLCTLVAPRSGPRSPQRPLVDKVHAVNTREWRRSLLTNETWEQMAVCFSELRAGRHEVAIDFQGAVRSGIVARWSKAPVIYGFAQPRENAASIFYTRQVQARGGHIIEQNLSLASAMAHCELSAPKVELPRDDMAEHACQKQLNAHSIRDYVIVNPGAGWGAKQWPAERYGQVAKRLMQEGLKSLINFGPGEEQLAHAAAAASEGTAQGFSGSLSELIALTRGARLFIGGDTGPMHLAAALGIPVVGIFGPTDPARNGPYGTRSVVLRSPASPTTHVRHRDPDEGMLEIGADDVIVAALKLLKDSGG